MGNVSYFKVYAGKLKSGDELINANNRNSERFGQLYVANGKNREAVDSFNGDIGVVVKLKDSPYEQYVECEGHRS